MFFLMYQLWKYQFLWVLDSNPASETGGLYFPKAIQHIFVGMYIQQICLAALFFLARDQNNKASAIPEGALMIVLIAFTAFYHLIINNSYGPLIEFLPLTLADQAHGKTDENVNVAAQELDDDVSCKDVKVQNQEQANATSTSRACDEKARKRASLAGSLDVDKAKATQVEEGGPSTPTSLRGVDEEEGPKDFYHPASVDPQPVVWIPRDPLGLGEAEEKACRDAGVDVSTHDAVMDGKGHVDISGPPPDEERRE